MAVQDWFNKRVATKQLEHELKNNIENAAPNLSEDKKKELLESNLVVVMNCMKKFVGID